MTFCPTIQVKQFENIPQTTALKTSKSSHASSLFASIHPSKPYPQTLASLLIASCIPPSAWIPDSPRDNSSLSSAWVLPPPGNHLCSHKLTCEVFPLSHTGCTAATTSTRPQRDIAVPVSCLLCSWGFQNPLGVNKPGGRRAWCSIVPRNNTNTHTQSSPDLALGPQFLP